MFDTALRNAPCTLNLYDHHTISLKLYLTRKISNSNFQADREFTISIAEGIPPPPRLYVTLSQVNLRSTPLYLTTLWSDLVCQLKTKLLGSQALWLRSSARSRGAICDEVGDDEGGWLLRFLCRCLQIYQGCQRVMTTPDCLHLKK